MKTIVPRVLSVSMICGAFCLPQAFAQSSLVLECTGSRTTTSGQTGSPVSETAAETGTYMVDYSGRRVVDFEGTSHQATIDAKTVTYGTSWAGKAMGGTMERETTGTIDRVSYEYRESRMARTHDGRTVFSTTVKRNGACKPSRG